jgi:hypothetical protein
MVEGDEVGELREAVNDCQDHWFAADLGESLDKVHGDVTPDRAWHGEQLKELDGMEMLGFVALAHRAPLDEGVHQLVVTRCVEGGAEAV